MPSDSCKHKVGLWGSAVACGAADAGSWVTCEMYDTLRAMYPWTPWDEVRDVDNSGVLFDPGGRPLFPAPTQAEADADHCVRFRYRMIVPNSITDPDIYAATAYKTQSIDQWWDNCGRVWRKSSPDSCTGSPCFLYGRSVYHLMDQFYRSLRFNEFFDCLTLGNTKIDFRAGETLERLGALGPTMTLPVDLRYSDGLVWFCVGWRIHHWLGGSSPACDGEDPASSRYGTEDDGFYMWVWIQDQDGLCQAEPWYDEHNVGECGTLDDGL